MPDNSPPPPGRKRALIAPLVICLTLATLIGVALALRGQRAAPPPAPLPPPPAPAPPVESPKPPLSRADILQDAHVAASAYALGAQPPGDRPRLVGRPFSVRIPFGCNGPGAAAPGAQADVELDPTGASLKLSARPAIWTSLPLFQDAPGAGRIETVEGFWIPRPWVDSEACPPQRDTPLPATPTPPAAQTVGLARIFEKGGSRVLMRGDTPYETTVKLPKKDAGLLRHSYRLVLEGRLTGYPDGRAAHCWSESPDHRPICLYAVTYDRVAFEDAATGKTVAEWRQ
ncbi:MAG: hypothetical protein JSS35_20150 [Proteobacteria bacterium]|nr:hypothetical protein [Pseudomonadota bacterium]